MVVVAACIVAGFLPGVCLRVCRVSPCVCVFPYVCVLVLLREERVVRDNERWKKSSTVRGGANRPQDSPILQL